jgi:hypothetical protein
VTAFLQQVVADFVSDHALLRAEAAQFLDDRAALEFWTSMVGVDAQAFLERAQQAKGPG